MRKLILAMLFIPVLCHSQTKERIPYKSYDFLKLVHKYYNSIPVVEEGFRSTDLIGQSCYLLTMPSGDLYYLYTDNVLKFSSGNTSVEVYQIGTNIAMFAVQVSDGSRQLIYSVNGEAKSKLKG